jgi:ABC-2 type transport system ATP-binding protein
VSAGGDHPAIEIRDLTKVFGTKRALDGVGLTVPRGAVFGFLGANGAGKSTTLNILTGLARPTAGTVRVLGHDIVHASNAVRAQIGYLPDVPGFYPWMTAPEFLRFAGSLFGLGGSTLEARIAALLDLAGLKGVDARIGGYSRGMRQRLGLAQALINAPALLLLDEPTSALDPMGRKAVLDMITALAGRTTIFFSTHILADVERVCDMVAILDRGRVVAQAPIAELRARVGTHRVSLTLGSRAEAEEIGAALAALPWVRRIEREGSTLEASVDDLGVAQREIPKIVAERSAALNRFESGEPTLEEVFLDLVGERSA